MTRRRRSTWKPVPPGWDLPPIDVRLLLVILVLLSLIFGVLVFAFIEAWIGTIIPPPFEPTQLETL